MSNTSEKKIKADEIRQIIADLNAKIAECKGIGLNVELELNYNTQAQSKILVKTTEIIEY